MKKLNLVQSEHFPPEKIELSTSKEKIYEARELVDKINNYESEIKNLRNSNFDEVKQMKKSLKKKLKKLVHKLSFISDISNGDKIFLIHLLKRYSKKICVICERFDDCYSITDLDLLVSIQNNLQNDVTRKSSQIIISKFAMIVKAMELSRNIYENMRRYMQY